MNPCHLARFPSLVALVPGFTILLAGCGRGPVTKTSSPKSPTLTTPLVSLTPASTNVTTAESLSTTVTVNGSFGTPAGSVTLSSGSYESSTATLSNASAIITIPAGALTAGTDTLTANYTPDATSSGTYNSSSGTVSVTVAAGASGLPTVTTSSVNYPTAAAPFQAAVSNNGTVFVAVSGKGVQVFTPSGSGLTPQCVNSFPSSLSGDEPSASNLSFLPNGTNLALGIGAPGVIFFNVSDLSTCTATGYVVSQGPIASDEGSQEVDATPDGKYAFVSNEYGVAAGAGTEGNIGVVQLQYDSNGNVTTGTTLLGQIATGGEAIAGMTLSPDGTRLYVTSEVSASSTAAGGSNPILSEDDCVQGGGSPQENGLLTVIDVATAESSPGPSAILATVDAGCSPVRMAETNDDSTLWVAARGDNRVLAFSTAMLETDPGNALVGYADTGGTAPVGIKLFHNDQLLAVANSNRFDTAQSANATILDVANPSAASVVAIISTGLFPREIWVAPDDSTLYLTNYDSDTLQVITTTVQ
jgi:DNA-binding beta-propeller fold protein YncE